MANSISPYIVEVTQVFTTFCAKILDFEDSQSHLLVRSSHITAFLNICKH